jgi:hypothetical protein
VTEAVDYPEPVIPESVSELDPATLPPARCGDAASHDPHVWIGAWDRGDEDPRNCPGV